MTILSIGFHLKFAVQITGTAACGSDCVFELRPHLIRGNRRDMTISPPHISPIAMQKILIILGELPTEHGSAAGNAVGFGQNRLIFSNPIEDQRSCIASAGSARTNPPSVIYLLQWV